MARTTLMSALIALSVCVCGCAKRTPVTEPSPTNKQEMSLTSVRRFCAEHIIVGQPISDALHVCDQQGWNPTDHAYGCLIDLGGGHKILISIDVNKAGDRVSKVTVTESFTYL
jgi:hypothetical protein